MDETGSEPDQLDLNQIRDDILAGQEVKPGKIDTTGMTDEEIHHLISPHLVNPDLHPEVDWSKDPDIKELRRVAQTRQSKSKEEIDRETDERIDRLSQE